MLFAFKRSFLTNVNLISNGVNTLRHVNKRYNWICHAYCLKNIFGSGLIL
jgi:hypothetical protein